ncbi:MAG: PqqD family protein [Actinomycetota bacterium]|nr:PqqD family protein [Actinomycetota bacterium]
MLQLATSSVEWRRVGDEIVILNTRTARYLALNRTGVVLWSALIEGSDEAALAGCVVDRFGLSVEQAHADVAAFVAELGAHGLLEPKAA